jgi:hypothetical protein
MLANPANYAEAKGSFTTGVMFTSFIAPTNAIITTVLTLKI